MKINDLNAMVTSSEAIYESVINTNSEKEVMEFLDTYQSVIGIFHEREQYKNGKTTVSDSMKIFYEVNSVELDILNNRAFQLFKKAMNQVKTIRATSALIAHSVFLGGSTEGVVTSQDIYASTMSHSDPNSEVTLDILLNKYKVSDKNIALRRAGHQGNVIDVELLITKFGADVNGRSSNGFTALDWAFYNNQMEPYGVFHTLCWLKADQTTLKPLLSKYTHDDENEYPIKDIALARAIEAENKTDINILVNRYKADMDAARAIIDTSGSMDPTSSIKL
ncbi:MAG: hypothetical protein P1U74_10885 [Legionellaceae bacterium]|nr:hypothetical protein [Legionellaceae bacterium]